jgi:peptide/nickel transport system substrate-binding protein
VAALLSGDVDMLTDLPTQDVARLRADPKLKILDGPEVRTIYLAPGPRQPRVEVQQCEGQEPVQADKRVRQALSMAIDREAIKRSTMRGLSMPGWRDGGPGRQRQHARHRRRHQGRPRWREEAAGRGRLPGTASRSS